MVELGNSQGPLTDAVAGHCREFTLSMKEIQTTLHEEIKGASEYHPFDKCDYSATIANEICCKKLEYVSEKMDALQMNIEQSNNEEIQTTLCEEIKSDCEYRRFEKCDYSARSANEICCKKLQYVIEKMDAMQLSIERSTNEV